MARTERDPASIRSFGFLTLPGYSMIAFASALEACRMANYVSRRELYRWRILSVDGAPVAASNGLAVAPTAPLRDAQDLDVVFVCGGVEIREAVSRPLVDALRPVARRGTALGSLCTGAFALAKAELLDGYRCAIHWENLSAIREEFPEVEFTEELFVVDRDRLTCTGGTAPLDMMLNLMRRGFGDDLAVKVSEQFVLQRIRTEEDRQRIPLRLRLKGSPPALRAAVMRMERTIETPQSISGIAEEIGISQRQLERLFKIHMGMKPQQYYLQLRLERARLLLLQTDMSITEIGVACGFETSAHFSTCYRRRYGHAPTEER
jgi:transcriptional regulator GlxA family with amidase domain